jgi:RNA polymerase II-associated factor 1
MRRPDYISTEQTRYQPTTIEKIESDIGYTVRKKMNVDDLYMDRDNQIKAIEKTFEDALLPIEKHYSKGHVYPVDVMPILPDSQMWKYPCAQVDAYFICITTLSQSQSYDCVSVSLYS